MIFEEKFTLSSLICDQDDRLTLWGLARLFQDIALDHSDTYGVGYNGLKPMNKAWILTHAYYQINRLPLAGERLTMLTWPRQDNGLIAPRDYKLIDSDGNLCAASTSNWVILNMDTRKVTRLGEIIEKFEKESLLATKYDKIDKLKMPDNLVHLKDITVPYSALDHTRHVNNAEYIKWICDEIPSICKSRINDSNAFHDNSSPESEYRKEIEESNKNVKIKSNRKEIAEFEINYLRETKYADPAVKMLTAEKNLQTNSNNKLYNSEHFFQVTNSSGISVNAKVTLG